MTKKIGLNNWRRIVYGYDKETRPSIVAYAVKKLDHATNIEKCIICPWPILPERVRSSIPSSLDIDTYQQMAWLGVVIFEIEGIYFRRFITDLSCF